MRQTFRIRRRKFVESVVCAILFLAMTVFALSMISVLGNQTHSVEDIVGITFFIGIILLLGSGAAFMVYAAVYCLRGHVAFDGTMVSIKKVRREIRFNIHDVVRLHWRGGVIIFHLLNRKAHIELSWFSREDRLAMIRFVREHVPSDKQEGWPLFCHRIALRTFNAVFNASSATPPIAQAPDQVLITRKRYDRALLIALPLSIIAAFAAWWLTGRPQIFVLLVFPLGFWAMLRWSVPNQGEVVRKMDGELKKMVTVAMLGILLLVSLQFIRSIGETIKSAITIVLTGITFMVMMIEACKLDKIEKQRIAAAVPTSVAQWDQIEHPPMDTAS